MSLFKYFNMGFAVAALLLTGSFNSVSAQEQQAERTASIEEIICSWGHCPYPCPNNLIY